MSTHVRTETIEGSVAAKALVTTSNRDLSRV